MALYYIRQKLEAKESLHCMYPVGLLYYFCSRTTRLCATYSLSSIYRSQMTNPFILYCLSDIKFQLMLLIVSPTSCVISQGE